MPVVSVQVPVKYAANLQTQAIVHGIDAEVIDAQPDDPYAYIDLTGPEDKCALVARKGGGKVIEVLPYVRINLEDYRARPATHRRPFK